MNMYEITRGLQAAKVRSIKWSCKSRRGRAHSFLQEWNAESIESLGHEEINRAEGK